MSVSRRSDSDIGEPEVGTDDDMDCGDEGGGGGREEVRRQLWVLQTCLDDSQALYITR